MLLSNDHSSRLSQRDDREIGDIYLSASLQSPFWSSIYVRVGRDLVDVDERSRRNDAEDVDFTRQLYYERAKRYHVQVVDEAESPRGMAKLQGTKKKRTKGYAKVRWYISFLLGIDQKKESTKKRRRRRGKKKRSGRKTGR